MCMGHVAHEKKKCRRADMIRGMLFQKDSGCPALSGWQGAMSYMNESCHTWMSHVTHEWVMSRMNVSSVIYGPVIYGDPREYTA